MGQSESKLSKKPDERHLAKKGKNKSDSAVGAEDKDVNLDSFKILRSVGRGAFGKVCIVMKKDTKAMYAMKYMSKLKCIEDDAIDNVLNEKSILEKLNHPLIVNLWFAFQDYEDFFYVVDLMMGGDLKYHLKRNGSLSERKVVVYLFELASALEYLHLQGIVHRDVKPANILLDELGHCHLADFNVAERVEYVTKAQIESIKQELEIVPDVFTPENYQELEKKQVLYGKCLSNFAHMDEDDLQYLDADQLLAPSQPTFEYKPPIHSRSPQINQPIPSRKENAEEDFGDLDKMVAAEDTASSAMRSEATLRTKESSFMTSPPTMRIDIHSGILETHDEDTTLSESSRATSLHGSTHENDIIYGKRRASVMPRCPNSVAVNFFDLNHNKAKPSPSIISATNKPDPPQNEETQYHSKQPSAAGKQQLDGHSRSASNNNPQKTPTAGEGSDNSNDAARLKVRRRYTVDLNNLYGEKHAVLLFARAGTRPYMAPEVLMKKGYLFKCDWWSLGVTLYELVRGRKPFRGGSGEEMMVNILTAEIQFPDYISQSFTSILKGLLKRDEIARAGFPNNLAIIKDSPLLRKLGITSWDDIREKKISPYYIPPKDKINCDATYELEEMMLEENPLHKKKKRLNRTFQSQANLYDAMSSNHQAQVAAQSHDTPADHHHNPHPQKTSLPNTVSMPSFPLRHADAANKKDSGARSIPTPEDQHSLRSPDKRCLETKSGATAEADEKSSQNLSTKMAKKMLGRKSKKTEPLNKLIHIEEMVSDKEVELYKFLKIASDNFSDFNRLRADHTATASFLKDSPKPASA